MGSTVGSDCSASSRSQAVKRTVAQPCLQGQPRWRASSQSQVKHVVHAHDPVVAAGLRLAGDEVADAVDRGDGAGGYEAGAPLDAAGGAEVRGGEGRDGGAEVWYAAGEGGAHLAVLHAPGCWCSAGAFLCGARLSHVCTEYSSIDGVC